MWVGNWREYVVSLGAPDARVVAFIAPGKRFLLDVSLSVVTGGWFSCCRWQEHCFMQEQKYSGGGCGQIVSELPMFNISC